MGATGAGGAETAPLPQAATNADAATSVARATTPNQPGQWRGATGADGGVVDILRF